MKMDCSLFPKEIKLDLSYSSGDDESLLPLDHPLFLNFPDTEHEVTNSDETRIDLSQFFVERHVDSFPRFLDEASDLPPPEELFYVTPFLKMEAPPTPPSSSRGISSPKKTNRKQHLVPRNARRVTKRRGRKKLNKSKPKKRVLAVAPAVLPRTDRRPPPLHSLSPEEASTETERRRILKSQKSRAYREQQKQEKNHFRNEVFRLRHDLAALRKENSKLRRQLRARNNPKIKSD